MVDIVAGRASARDPAVPVQYEAAWMIRLQVDRGSYLETLFEENWDSPNYLGRSAASDVTLSEIDEALKHAKDSGKPRTTTHVSSSHWTARQPLQTRGALSILPA